jgi:hypothetical protein
VAALLADLDADPRIVVVPLDRAILDLSLTLAAISEMHDRQIAATALHLARAGSPVPLLSCDSNITASGLVPIVWQPSPGTLSESCRAKPMPMSPGSGGPRQTPPVSSSRESPLGNQITMTTSRASTASIGRPIASIAFTHRGHTGMNSTWSSCRLISS